MEKRMLKPKEINCRVQQISEKGLSLLLYITSRAGQNILDERYGELGWKREHQVIDGNLYCTISVFDDNTQQWISRQDVGKESYTEKEKGQASDSFKRACVNFGIGRELYSAPHIWLDSKQVNIKPGSNGKFTTYDKFYVRSITYNSVGEIDSLEIINQKMEVVYKKWPAKKIDTVKIKLIQDELKRTGVSMKKILDMCSIQDITEMLEDDFSTVYAKLKASKDKV